MSGNAVGVYVRDQAECRRFTFDPKWTVNMLLNTAWEWCTPATHETLAESGRWYELLPEFRPTAVVFSNGSLAMPGEYLCAVPGPITLMESSEVQLQEHSEESVVRIMHGSEESMSLSRTTVAVDMGDSEATPSFRAGSIIGKSPNPSLLEELWERSTPSQSSESIIEQETAVCQEVDAGARSAEGGSCRVKLKNRSLNELLHEKSAAAAARMLLERWYQLASENLAP